VNRKQNAFVAAYIREHFGELGVDPEVVELVQSDALRAYYKLQGFVFGPDEEALIIPDFYK